MLAALLAVAASLLTGGGVAFAQEPAYCRATWTDRVVASRVAASYLIPAGEGRLIPVPPASRPGAAVYLARNWGMGGDYTRGGCTFLLLAAPAGAVLVEAPPPGSGMVLYEVRIIEVDEAVSIEDRRDAIDTLSGVFGGASIGDGLRGYLRMPLVAWLLAASVGLILGWRTVASIKAAIQEVLAAAPELGARHDLADDEDERDGGERWVE